MNNNKSKFNTILYIVVLVVVFIMFVATSYLYYNKVIKSKEKENTNVIVKYLNMMVTFNNNSQINGYNIKPGWEESLDFSITNYSKDTIGKYKIIIEVITPFSNMIDENFIYSVEGESESKDTSNKVLGLKNMPIPIVTKDLGNFSITPNNTHNYKLTLKLNDDADENKYNDGKIFAIKIKVVNAN